MPEIHYSRLFALRNWISLMAAFAVFKTGAIVLAQNDSAAEPNLGRELLDLRLGPFDLHPRLAAGFTYDDNISYSAANKQADTEWAIQPAFQAVAGDDAALITYRDQGYDVLSLSPGSIIIQRPEVWPGKLFILDYGPRFQFFDKYTANNSIDQFGTLNLLWPMSKLILGLKQDYQLQKEQLMEAGQRSTVESTSSTLTAAYQFGDKTSLESDFRRLSIGYNQPGLVGYTEYINVNWLNYGLAEDLAVSAGGVAGSDTVANHQDQTFEQLGARARYSHTEKLAFDVSAGGELRQYENGNPQTFSPVFTMSGIYRPAERTSLSLTGYRQQFAAILNGYYYTSTGATLAVRQGITDRFTAGLSIAYYSLNYTPIGGSLMTHTDGYYSARITLGAKIARYLNGEIFYQSANRQSQVNGDMNDNQSGVQLTLSF